MGLIKAGMGAVGGMMADQWREFFYCEAMDKDVRVNKDQTVQRGVLQIQKAMLILFLMDRVLPLQTDIV